MKWSPDTCGCIFECVINNLGDLDWIQSYSICPIHIELTGQTLLNTVVAENRSKNQALEG